MMKTIIKKENLEKRVLQYYYELGIFVTNLINSGISFSQVGRHLRKHPEFIVYYKVFWEKIKYNLGTSTDF